MSRWGSVDGQDHDDGRCQRVRAGYWGVQTPDDRYQPVELLGLSDLGPRPASGAGGLDLLHRAAQQAEHVALRVSQDLPRGIGGLADLSSCGAEGQ